MIKDNIRLCMNDMLDVFEKYKCLMAKAYNLRTHCFKSSFFLKDSNLMLKKILFKSQILPFTWQFHVGCLFASISPTSFKKEKENRVSVITLSSLKHPEGNRGAHSESFSSLDICSPAEESEQQLPQRR